VRRPPGRGGLAAALVLAAALAAFTANIGGLTLPSIDDCFYARKGVEMARRDAFFTVTWNGVPSFTYPPLQFWILGRAFAAFGEHDAAARLPGVLMAAAILATTGWLAVRTAGAAGAATGATAMALLALSPYFLQNARRCMTEIPLAFWTTMALAVLVTGLRRPRLHLLLAVPLAAGILTKSLLGLLPLGALAGAALVNRDVRASLRSPWLLGGIVLGLAGGASWSLHQWATFGRGAIEEHYLSGVLALSTRPLGWLQRLTGYPLILLRDFEPVVLPAVAGLWAWWRTRAHGDAGDPGGTRGATRALVAAWWVVPFALYGLSSTQSARYLFPAFPAMAVIGGVWLGGRWPRVARAVRVGAPVVLAAVAVAFWAAPGLLTRDSNRAFRDDRAAFQRLIPAGEPLAFVGDDYWRYANPLLYYDERVLEPASDGGAAAAIARARTRTSGLVLVERRRLDEVEASVPGARTRLSGPGWVVLDVRANAAAGDSLSAR